MLPLDTSAASAFMPAQLAAGIIRHFARIDDLDIVDWSEPGTPASPRPASKP